MDACDVKQTERNQKTSLLTSRSINPGWTVAKVHAATGVHYVCIPSSSVDNSPSKALSGQQQRIRCTCISSMKHMCEI